MPGISKITSVEVPYFEDVAPIFSSFAQLPWAIFLDSGRPMSKFGRYEIFSAYPKKTFVTQGRLTTITSGGNQQMVPDDPFDLLASELSRNYIESDDFPFSGGALGFFSYDLGRRIESIPNSAIDDIGIPEMAVGIYHWAYIADHIGKKAMVVGNLSEPRVRLNWQDIIEKVSSQKNIVQYSNSYRALNKIQSNMTAEQYKEKFSSVKNYIGSGDCYQVNLAQRFTVNVEGDSWSGYQRLRKINPSPFSAYINIPECKILSVSPERFLQVNGDVVITKPIKGTRPRSNDTKIDQKLQEELVKSTKDRAENVMIVDLLRNDLSKCCEINTVKVTKLFDIESYPTVHHLVSTIEGKLPSKTSPVELLRECFPGGSITGAPKIRAMEIIEELEPHRRGLYCGSVGYIGFNRKMDTNIAIRTVIQKHNQAYFYAGGGLVWDSKVDEEYQETFDKAAAIFRFFEQ
ncbi:MAG: aminodeoxychorismate synthase component I [Gammaproteobacteria bacterium]|nr:aminodeoxychorismate synthase component I [Gammaproteobacteria bacterium]